MGSPPKNESNLPPMTRIQKLRLSSHLKLILIISILTIVIICAKIFPVKGLLYTALLWVKNVGFFAPIAFIIIYNLATVLLIPGSILTLGGGVLFGLFKGSIYVFIAATLGAIFAFLIGRYLSRDWVYQQMQRHPKFNAIEAAVAENGLKIVFLCRLSPILPFNLLNYAFGITQISLKEYILGSFGIIPGTIMYVYMGSLAGDLSMIDMVTQTTMPQAYFAQWLMSAIGLIATVAVTIYVGNLAKKALDES
jgi:uncharacterized membrane protein YdjX (TVP38/TMEM64 family)